MEHGEVTDRQLEALLSYLLDEASANGRIDTPVIVILRPIGGLHTYDPFKKVVERAAAPSLDSGG